MTRTRTAAPFIRAIGVLGTAALLAALLPGQVMAAPPGNDEITAPTLVTGIPYSDGPYDTGEATTGATDPGFCFAPEEGPDAATVWYSFTPATDGRYLADTFGSSYDTTIYVGTPDGAGGIDVLACNDDTMGLQAAVVWEATAGTTYLIAIGTCCAGGEVGEAGPGGTLLFHVDVAPSPASFDLAVDPVGTISRYGTVTISGTATCANAEGGAVDIVVEQRVGRFILRGFAFVEVACDGSEQAWTVDVTSDDGRFAGSRVSVTAFGSACTFFECADDFETVTVRLRR